MLIQSIQLNNFLSFGASSAVIPLGPLNVIIGPNGSGKSNLLESIELLRSAPEQLLKPIRKGGGVRDWLWKGAEGTPTASLDVLLANPKGEHSFKLLAMIDPEKVVNASPWARRFVEALQARMGNA